MDEDAKLMVQVKQGDDAAFDLLMNRYKRPLVNFIYRMIQNVGTAEEIAQDVFVRVYLSRKRYEPECRFSTWLFKIATNTTLKYIRKHKRLVPMAEVGENNGVSPAVEAHERLEKEETALAVRRALAGLPENERLAIILCKYQDCSYQEIAVIMKCSLGAIKTYIHRGKLRLRELLIGVEKGITSVTMKRQVDHEM